MKISTSILDCANRLEGVLELNNTNINYIHVDVMDGKFVPREQFMDISEIREVNRVSNKSLDIHLMIDDPIFYIDELKDMNVEFITVHLEIDKDLKKIFSRIRGLGYKVGLSIKPGTDIRKIESYLDDVDLVLVMSVEPGLGGQEFKDSTVERVNQLKKLILRSGRNILIEVDGGINNETIVKLEKVDIAVVGSYITKSDNYYDKIEALLSIVNNFDE